MDNRKFLVIGATGHVGSQVAINLANRGYDVSALVRRSGMTIQDPCTGTIKYVVGDLPDEESVERAVKGIDVVISTANGIAPQNTPDNARSVNESATRLISICERAGVQRFVQSSVPTYKGENRVPELQEKRLIEKRLATSAMQSIIIRNAAFMDVWIVMVGFKQAQDQSRHATTKRNYGLLKLWTALVGNFVEKRGWMLAPGGAKHGTPIIATRDVAEMLVGGALYEGGNNLLIEAGGPEWLTWREIAETIAAKTGRRIRVIPLPAWVARMSQLLIRPFSEAGANVLGLMAFVAEYQPHWNSEEAIKKLKLPEQLTLSDYLDLNYKPCRQN